MAAKKPAASKLDPKDVPVTQGVDAEAAYKVAQDVTDSQWMQETTQRWNDRQAKDNAEEIQKVKGEAVVNLADASGAVGQIATSSIVLADASTSDDNKAAVVKDKKDDSDDKGGYIWGGLGLLGLVGVAAAAGGGGGGGGGSSPAPMNLDGLVIDDPVANAIVFRDYYGDGYLHVVAVDGGYVIDPNQSVVVTDENGQFSDLDGSGRIISAGINALPIKVYAPDLTGEDEIADTDDDLVLTQAIIESTFDDQNAEYEVQVASHGDSLFESLVDANDSDSINNGEYAYIVGENEIFNSLVVSSGIELSVNGANVTLVTGVTALVDVYLNRYEGDFDATSEADVKAATAEVAALFGYELDEDSSDEDYMSFLLGGYDVSGVDSPNNLNQEIYSVINSVLTTIDALGYEGYDLSTEAGVSNYLAAFSAVLDGILLVQAGRSDDNLATFANDPELLSEIIDNVFDIVNFDEDPDLVNELDKQLFVDMALNHATSGGGAADIYQTSSYSPFVNVVDSDGGVLAGEDLSVVGNITVLAGQDFDNVSVDAGYPWGPVQLMGSNINAVAYGEDSSADVFAFAVNASGSEMSNGTLTYSEEWNSADVVPLGDINAKAIGDGSDASIDIVGDFSVAGNINVLASGNESFGDNASASVGLYAYESSHSHFSEINLHGVLANIIDEYDEDLNPDLVLRLNVDGNILSANVDLRSLNYDNIYEHIASIVNEWKADQDYSDIDPNVLEFWGDDARIRFVDNASHDVSANLYVGSIPFDVEVYTEEGYEGQAVKYDHTNISVVADGVYADAYFETHGGEGVVGSITVETNADNASASADMTLSGTIVGDLNVTASGYESDASIDINSISATLAFDHTDINIIATGDFANASADIGNNPNGWDNESTRHLAGDIDNITVKATGESSLADAYIQGDFVIHDAITVEANGSGGSYASADLVLSTSFGSTNDLASSRLTYEDIEINVLAYGDEASADLDASTNAFGTISSITVEANAVAALDGLDNEDNAFASADITIAGQVGDVTVSALSHSDEAQLSMQSVGFGNASWQMFNLFDLQDSSNLGNLSVGEKVELLIGETRLTYLVTEAAQGDEISVLKEAVAAFEEQKGDLNLVIGHVGDSFYPEGDGYDTFDGVYVRWLETGEQVEATLIVDGIVFTDSDSNVGDERANSIIWNNSNLTIEALNDDAYASLDVGDSTGHLASVNVVADGYSSYASADVNFGGTIGSELNVSAIGGEAEALLAIWTDSEGIEYVNTNLSVVADTEGEDDGLDGWATSADFEQEGYATGTINSISLYVNGSNDATANVALGGDITISSTIDVFAQNLDDPTHSDFDSDAYLHLNNQDLYMGSDSTFNMDGVVINVEARGFTNALVTTEAEYSYSSNESLVTGNISELNVYAGRYLPNVNDEEHDPNHFSGAESSADLYLDASVGSITAVADHMSSADIHLHGNIITNDTLVVDLSSTNSGDVSVGLGLVNGDVSNINIETTEDANTFFGMSIDGDINNFDILTTTDGFTGVELSIQGQNNILEELNISTLGTSTNEWYSSNTVVGIQQEAHGGVVNVSNSNGINEYFADTLLSYDGDFQADIINLGVQGSDNATNAFWLNIENMADVDVYSSDTQTALVDNMTTITHLTNGSESNNYANYIQFEDIDDANYEYDSNDDGSYQDDSYGISHYSNGQDGWVYNGVNTADSQNIGTGLYGSFNEFFDAAQYGIASEYAFINLDNFAAANNVGSESTWGTLTVNYHDAYNNAQEISLNYSIGGGLGGSLGGDTSAVLSDLFAHDMNGDNVGYYAWEDDYRADNLQLFNAGNNLLGIRLGEGVLDNVTFWSNTDAWGEDGDGDNYGLGANDSDFESSTSYGQSYNADSIHMLEGGGYFFGMVKEEGSSTYRGVLAMDADGEGVTKLIELDDVTDYNQFSSAYIGAVESDPFASTYGFYNDDTIYMYPDLVV